MLAHGKPSTRDRSERGEWCPERARDDHTRVEGPTDPRSLPLCSLMASPRLATEASEANGVLSERVTITHESKDRPTLAPCPYARSWQAFDSRPKRARRMV